MHVSGCHSPSQRLTGELQTQLKAITRECPSLPSKETLLGWLQEREVAPCVLAGAQPGWRSVKPSGSKELWRCLKLSWKT